MKAEINTQSQNEVKDLLNEYVVSPLNTDISKTLSELNKQFEASQKSAKDDLNKELSRVLGNISRLQSLLDFSFHFDDEEDVFENLSDKIDQNKDDISEIIVDIETIIKRLEADFEKFDKRINDTTIKNSQELTESISKQFMLLEQLCQKLQLASDEGRNEIILELSSLRASVSKETADISLQIKGAYEQSEKRLYDTRDSLNERLLEIETLISESNEGVTESISSHIQTVYDYYNEQKMEISNYHEENKTEINSMKSQQQVFIEQKYKKLFAASLFFGIVNAVGIATMLVLFMIK